VNGRHDAVTYRLVQVISGHGCFGDYLHRIGREESAACHHCGADRDTAQHTLEECPAWDAQRRVLVQHVGEDLSLPALVKAMVDSEGSRRVASSFCEHVMLEGGGGEGPGNRGPSNRRRRGGARRRTHNRLTEGTGAGIGTSPPTIPHVPPL